MFCPNCRKEIKENSKFCGNCGATINYNTAPSSMQNPTVSPAAPTTTKPKKKSGKKLLVCLGLVGVLAIGAYLAYSIYNQPTARINRMLSAGNYMEAFEIYETELDGKELSEKTLDLLVEAANSAASAYEENTASYEDATKHLSEIKMFASCAGAPLELIEDAEQRVDALKNLKECLKTADAFYEQKDYLGAMQYYNYALDMREDAKDALEGLSKAKDAYRDDILAQFDAYISKRDYDSAESTLNTALGYLEDDSILKEKLNGLDDVRVKDIVNDAYSYTQGGDWDAAVELLEDAQSQFTTNPSIAEAYKDIKEKMPITLENITTISSSNINVIRDVLKDRFGNVYDGGVLYDAVCSPTYGVYHLSSQYKSFDSIAFVGTQCGLEQKYSIAIYVDEELVFFKDEITEESQPIAISIDLTNKDTMRIVTTWYEGAWGSNFIYFSNSSFEKAESPAIQE